MTTTIRALNDVVLFQFLESTSGQKGKFAERITQAGIILGTLDSQQKVNRWGQVYAVGPKAEPDLSVGQYILIEALMWMEGIKLDDGTKVWKTDPTKVLLVTDDIDETYTQ